MVVVYSTLHSLCNTCDTVQGLLGRGISVAASHGLLG